MRIVLAIALGVVALAQQGPEGTAVVRGRVVDGTSGRPLRHVTVQFYPQHVGPYTPGLSAEPPARSAVTGADGSFELADLASAVYSVTAGSPDYLPIEYGSSRPGGGGKSLRVADHATLEIAITAWKGGTIAGHVFDERGRPVIDAQVRVYAKDADRYGSAATNDLGEYEIGRLVPGEYAVGVAISYSSRTLSSVPARQDDRRTWIPPYLLDRGLRTVVVPYGVPLPAPADDGRPRVYTSAFAGGAATASRALYLPLGSGDVRDQIDITLPAVRGTRVAGVAASASDIKGTIVTLTPEGESRERPVMRIDATTASDGTFTFVAVPAGKYTLTARRRRPPLTEVTLSGGSPVIAQDDYTIDDDEDLWADMPFTVGDADVSDLAVTLWPGTPIKGRIVIEDDVSHAAPQGQPRLSLLSSSTIAAGDDRGLRVDRDGSVAARVKPGSYRIAGGSINGAVLKRVVVNGHEIEDGRLVVGTEPIVEAQFVFGRFDTVVRGTIVDAQGAAAESATVLIFPADRSQWFRLEMSPRARVIAAEHGVYQITSVAPGDYYIAAVSSFRQMLSPAIAAGLTAGAQRLTVREHEPQAVALALRDPE